MGKLLPEALIHNDLLPSNILVEMVDGDYKVRGILDFDDMISSARVFELAKFIYFFREVVPHYPFKDYMQAVVAAWEEVIPLEDIERSGLGVFVG